MRHDYSTEQFQAFRQDVRESFLGQVRWRTPTRCSTAFIGALIAHCSIATQLVAIAERAGRRALTSVFKA
jgi:hypothetical protein